MAITLNKLAAQCEQIALDRGKISPSSSARPLLYDISRKWRRQLDASNFKSELLPRWSEKEVAAGELIISALEYLQRISCKNIEMLLREVYSSYSIRR